MPSAFRDIQEAAEDTAGRQRGNSTLRVTGQAEYQHLFTQQFLKEPGWENQFWPYMLQWQNKKTVTDHEGDFLVPAIKHLGFIHLLTANSSRITTVGIEIAAVSC